MPHASISKRTAGAMDEALANPVAIEKASRSSKASLLTL
jgi:hypothetical protein